jgi:hypothetical protein
MRYYDFIFIVPLNYMQSHHEYILFENTFNIHDFANVK